MCVFAFLFLCYQQLLTRACNTCLVLLLFRNSHNCVCCHFVPSSLYQWCHSWTKPACVAEVSKFHIWACAKRCSVRTIHFLVLNASSGLSFLWTNLTLSERACIKEIIKINLTPRVSSELVKYENLHQVRAENRQKKCGHFGCTASVVVLFASFFFRQFSLCCLTGHSQSFLMLVKTAHNYL